MRPRSTGASRPIKCFLSPRRRFAVDRSGVLDGLPMSPTIPNPDLAIEVDISPPKVDRPGIYAALKVMEVWRFTDSSVTSRR